MSLKVTRAMAIGLATASALLLAACGGGDSDDGETTAEPTGTTEPTATQAAEGGSDDGVLFDGEPVAEFYSLNCSSCHGANREGITGLGLPLVPDALTQDDDFYRDTIKNGRASTVMPAWSARGMTDAEIDALVAFIRTEP